MMNTMSFSFLSALIISVVSAADVQLLIYETDVNTNSVISEQAATISGIQASVIGSGTTFNGFGSKYEAVLPVLRSMDADALVILSDGRDVIINDHLNNDGSNTLAVEEFRQAFEELTAQYPGAIVASAESQCCVGALTYAQPGDYFDANGNRKERACASGNPPCLWNGDDKVVPWENFMKDLAMQNVAAGEDKYLNAGLMAGKAGDMLKVLEMADIAEYEDDQAVLTDFMYRLPNLLILDYNQVIFGNNRHSIDGCMFEDETEDARLVHMETGTTPLFIHSPGGFITCHERLASRLGVKMESKVEERRMLQGWKRDLQNYPPPPVCDFVCPANSSVKPNVMCLDTFNDCKCNTGFKRFRQVCIPEGCTGIVTFQCPANSTPLPNAKCVDTFRDCKCAAGFVRDFALGQCVVDDDEEPVCEPITCPANSTPLPNAKCINTFRDCKCNEGLVRDFALGQCVVPVPVDDCEEITCPANSTPLPNAKCVDTILDCKCNVGFTRDIVNQVCVQNSVAPICDQYQCPPNSRVKNNVMCLDTFQDCLCATNFKPDFATGTCIPN